MLSSSREIMISVVGPALFVVLFGVFSAFYDGPIIFLIVGLGLLLAGVVLLRKVALKKEHPVDSEASNSK